MTTILNTYAFRLQNMNTLERKTVNIVARDESDAVAKFHEIQELENYLILNIKIA